MQMTRFRGWTIGAGGGLLMLSAPAFGYEAGYPGTQVLPGVAIGGTTASVPGPGVYMFDQFSSYQATVTGPGTPKVNGHAASVGVDTVGAGFLWVPGWTFLGATYDAVLVQPVADANVGAPVNTMKVGLHNVFVAPVELSWKFGDSGFFTKAGLGVAAPDGTTSGANGLASVGNPWWTIRPELIFSYLKDGWNLTAAAYLDINTPNSITHYRTGDVLDVEFAATKTIGKWTFGPVGYYVGQITNDTSSAYYAYAINANKFNVYAAGGLIGYNFGTADVKVWAFDEFYANASGGTPIAGVDRASVSRGIRAYASISYKLWSPDDQSSDKKPRFYNK